jgi:hypothetical protein
MHDALDGAKQRFAREIDFNFILQSKPIAADAWVISSLLQKSIRRGETEIAQRAAFTFFHLKGAAIWRRLMVIAFEDIGIGSVDALTKTVAAAGDSAWRKSHGGDLRLAVYLAGLLAEAPKDRSADYLCDAKDHPTLADFWRAMEEASLASKILHVRDQASVLQRSCRSFVRAGCWVGRLHFAKHRRAGGPSDCISLTASDRGTGRSHGNRRCAHPRADHGHGAADLACGAKERKSGW